MPENESHTERDVEIYSQTSTRFELKDTSIDLKTFRVSNLENPKPATPGLMDTGSTEEVLRLYRGRKDLIHGRIDRLFIEIPYITLFADDVGDFGDFSTQSGQDAFANSDVIVEAGENSHPDWAKELHRFAALKLACKFSLDEQLTALRGIERDRHGKIRFKVGMSLYSQAFYSMGSEGVRFAFTDSDRNELVKKNVEEPKIEETREEAHRLAKLYGEGKTIRDAIMSKTGGLPNFNERVHNYLLGVAGTAITKDLPQHLGRQMHEEAKEEIGLHSGELLLGAMQTRIKLELGIETSEYDLIPVGMARELPRGGSPEAMFMIRFHGSTKDLVSRIAANPHEDRNEIDKLVYAYPAENISKLLRQMDADRVVQHKGLLNLMMIEQFMRQNA